MSIVVFIPIFLTVLRCPSDDRDTHTFLNFVWNAASLRLQEAGIKRSQLSLRALHNPILLEPVETLPRRIQEGEANNESKVIHGAVSQNWCDEERLHVYVYVDRGPVVQAAEKLKKTLWGKEIDVILTKTSDNAWRYVSEEWIRTLGLRYIGFNESNGLLIRPEYDAALRSPIFDHQKAMQEQFFGVVVTGQPGIGKTSFLYYLLFYLLCKQTPVALELKSEFLVFQDGGVSTHSLTANGTSLPEGSWALSDSNVINERPCNAFLDAAGMARTWVIQSTSPLYKRWKAWKKEYNAIMFVMDPFSIDEMAALGEVLSLEPDNLRRNYEKWGSSARTCVRCSRRSELEDEHESVVISETRKLIASPNPSGILDEDPMAVPHNLFLLEPLDKDDVGYKRMTAKAKIATPHIRKLISYEFAAFTARERVNFFQTLSRQPLLRSAVGTLFERFFLCWLASGFGSLHCTRAPSSHGSNALKIPSCAGKDQTVFFNSMTGLKKMKKTPLPSCFLPVSQTFPTIDAIILTEEFLITVQVTVSNQHSAKRIGFDRIRESGIRKKDLTTTKDRGWCHVFVTEEESTAISLRNQTLSEVPEDISIYSAVFDVSRSDRSIEKIRAFDTFAHEKSLEDIMDVDE